MKDSETKQQFIALRAKGKSYDTIARELDASKPTLLKWGCEYREEIENRKAIELEALTEEYWLTTEAQVKLYGAERQRVLEELKKRDLSAVPTPKLYDLLAKLEAQLKAACPEPAISDENTLTAQKVFRQLVSSSGNGNGATAASQDTAHGTAVLRAEDLVALQFNTLHRFQAGVIGTREARTELALINGLLKAVELVEIQKRLERIEELVRQPS